MQRPSELSRRLDPSQLLGHFVAGRSLPFELPGWHQLRLDGWTLMHEPRLPVQGLLDSAGTEIGWLLGHPIDLDARTMIAGPLRSPLRRDAGEVDRGFEDWLYTLGGRFAAIVLRPKPVLYPDGGTTLPVLFDPELQCVASSPFLLCSPDGTVPDSALVDAIAVFDTGSWFTLGMTSHARADLLLANHALDLSRWTQSRIWPLAPFDYDGVESLVELVATTLERTIAAAAATGHPNVGLTAGGDSRSLLACSRGVLDRMRFFTVAFPDHLGATDLATAPVLAKRFGLEHQFLPWLEPSMTDVDLFMYRTGCLVGEPRGRRASRSYAQLGGGEVYVSSVGAEISRKIGQRHFDLAAPLEPEAFLPRFEFCTHPELLRRASDWLSALPEGLSRLDTLTLFYAEMDNYMWGGLLTTAYPEAYSFTLYPYAHRTILDAVLRLPEQYRLSGRLRQDVVAARWKELLDVPINRRPVRVAVRRKALVWRGMARAGLSWKSWNHLLQRACRRLGRPSSGH